MKFIKEYYSNKSIKAKYTVDHLGNKHGLVQYFYPNGDIIEEATYYRGKLLN